MSYGAADNIKTGYGGLDEDVDGRPGPSSSVPINQESFSIVEPASNNNGSIGRRLNATTYQSHNGGRCGLCFCCGGGRGENDGLKIIVTSMFVFAVAVTVAMIIQIASGVSPTSHSSDRTASSHPKCDTVGDLVMSEGGNAVDAAVAASLCLTAVAPHQTGLGGGGVMMIHQNRPNKTVIIDFRETAPENVHDKRKYTDDPSLADSGWTSVGVPGFVKGLEHAHSNYGSNHVGLKCCSWSQLVWMAVRVADEARPTEHLLNATHTMIHLDGLNKSQTENIRDFLLYGGKPLHPELNLKSVPMYGAFIKSLKAIAHDGSKAFYEGEIAANLVKESQGLLTHRDLKTYKVKEREPIETIIGGFKVLTSPAPTSGPRLLSILNALEEYNTRYRVSGAVDANYLRNLSNILEKSEELQLALGDLNQNVEERTQYMVNKQNAPKLLNEVGDQAFGSQYPLSSPSSVHVAAMDRKDNYVSVVTSLNTWFGSKIMSSDGIILNNALSNFARPWEVEAGSETSSNYMIVGARPLTRSVVALAMDKERICGNRLVTGAAAADGLAEVLYDSLLIRQTLQDSIDNPRLHVYEETLVVEDAFKSFKPKALEGLRKTSGDHFTWALLPFTSINGVDKYIDNVLPVTDRMRIGVAETEVK